MSIEYRHTQSGTLILVSLAVVAIVISVSSTATRGSEMAILLGGILLMGILFGTLTVEVARGAVRCWFGPGLIRKHYSLTDIVEVETVRNHWYYGWGIRYTPRGWLFSVSGLDAVELTLSSGRHFRIGTDEPDELARAIRRAVALSSG